MQPWHHFVTLKPELQSGELTDGTLRLHLPEDSRAYLIEEPENGVHPLAVEAAYRSLSSAHDAQVLIATHSPVLLACTEPSELLCFSKRNGETQITRGDKHPHLADWQTWRHCQCSAFARLEHCLQQWFADTAELTDESDRSL